MTTAGCSACACSSQNPRAHPPRPGGAGRTDRPLDATKARAASQSSFARCTRAATVAPAAPRPWTGSSRPRAERTILAKLHCTLARARAVPSAAQAVRSRTQWQRSGEPSSGGWPTPRASCATTNIGVRLDARPALLSAVLENECGNPAHDRVATFRRSFRHSPPGRAIALRLLVVRLRHVRVAPVVRTMRVCPGQDAIGSPGCSGIVGHRLPARAAAIRGHKSTRLASALRNCVGSGSWSSGPPVPVWVARQEERVNPRAFIS